MAKDIAPELIEKVQKAFAKKYQSSQKIKEALEVINKGEATYRNASAFAEEVGDLLAKTFQEEIGKENLPDGRMYYNIADRLLNDTLGKNYDLISSYTKDMQKVLNEKAGIGIKPAVPKINQSRIDHMVDRIAKEEDYDKIKWMLDEPVTNFSMSVVDDFVKENVKLHYDMGLHPKIVRKENGKCCDWCKEVVGSYSYPDEVPKDVYKRHRYCRCTVEYFPGDGKKQDVWSKKWEDVDREVKIQERKNLEKKDGGFTNSNPAAFSKALAEAKASLPEDTAWRVTGYEPEHYAGVHIHVTPGGSTVAVDQEGDIISVCKNMKDTLRGSDLIQEAVKNGGTKLDSFSGNHKFYMKNGFSPISRCEFNEEYAPDGWLKGRDKPEDVVFYRYTGTQDIKDWEDIKNDVKLFEGEDAYDQAMKYRDDMMNEGGENDKL